MSARPLWLMLAFGAALKRLHSIDKKLSALIKIAVLPQAQHSQPSVTTRPNGSALSSASSAESAWMAGGPGVIAKVSGLALGLVFALFASPIITWMQSL